MELKVINSAGKSAASISASDDLFGREYNEALVHQLVTAYQANARSANSKQKGRSEIAKSTRKPWAQKGTGRARSGWHPAHCGAGAVRYSRIARKKTTHKKSTAKCIAPVWLQYFHNWFVKIV